jgi:hypothetical protein
MITHTKKIKEYRKDSSLRYECTLAYIAPETEYLYDKRIGEKGKSFIRINKATKYKIDGSIEWQHIYNDMGEVIGTHKGTIASRKLKFK